jgi:hypothetical protein
MLRFSQFDPKPTINIIIAVAAHRLRPRSTAAAVGQLGGANVTITQVAFGHFRSLRCRASRFQLRIKPSHSPSAQARVFSIASPCE